MYLVFKYQTNLLNRVNKSNISTFNIDGIKFDTFPNGVPKLIHYMIDDETKIPMQYKSLMESCIKVNPDIKFVLWTDKSIVKLVKFYYQQKQINKLSNLYNETEKLKKIDVARPLIIYLYGGIYLNLDTRCQKPLQNVMLSYKHSCLFGRAHEISSMIRDNLRNLIMNFLIVCIPYHNFFKYYIDHLVPNDKTYFFDSTGPYYIQILFDKYMELFAYKSTNKHYYIGLGDWKIFSSNLKNLEEDCKEAKNGTLKWEACLKYPSFDYMKNTFISQATLVNLGLHLGRSGSKNKITKTFNIKIFNSSVILVS